MTTRFFALYISAVLGLAFLACSVITLVPGPGVERARLITQAALGVCAVSFGVFGMVAGCLPSQHWINRSVMLRGALLLIAAVGTLFVLSIVG